MLQKIKDYINFKKYQKKPIVERKYFEKYQKLLDTNFYRSELSKYQNGNFVCEPLRIKLSDENIEQMYWDIDASQEFSNEEKFKLIVGTFMLLDGAFPESDVVVLFKKIFGTEFVETMKETKKKIEAQKAVERLIEFIKNKKK